MGEFNANRLTIVLLLRYFGSDIEQSLRSVKYPFVLHFLFSILFFCIMLQCIRTWGSYNVTPHSPSVPPK